MRSASKLAQHSTSLLDEPFTELNIATEQRTGRSPGFLLDPFICEAVKVKGLYPPVPTSKELAAKGFVLDSEELKTAIQMLLSRANAPLSKESLYAGVGKMACFSPALHQYLMANFESPLRQKVRCFLSHGQLIEHERSRAVSRAQIPQNSASNILPTHQPFNATAPSAESTADSAALISDAPSEYNCNIDRDLRSEIDLLQKQLAQLLMQKDSHSGQTAEVLAVTRKEMERAISERNDANRRYWRLAKRRQEPFRIPMSDGTLATPIKVDNLVFDPRVEREPGQERTRLPTFCTKAVALIIHGSKEPRPDGPGWRWTVLSKLNEFQNWGREGIEAAHRSPWLREMNLNDRMMTMYVVPTGRKNYVKRHKLETIGQAKNRTQQYNGFRLLDNPSAKTTHNRIIPAFLNLFGLWIVEVLQDPSTVRIGASSDGMKAKSCGLLGTYFSVFQRTPVFRDPLGNVQKKTKCLRFPGPMTQTSNKLVKTLKDSMGGEFPPEAAFGMAKALYVGNLARMFLQNSHLFDLCLDGASENKGCGPARETAERMCGKNSIFDQLIAGRGIWQHVLQQAEEKSLKGPMDEFFGNNGVEWEEEWSADKLAPASTTLDTSGPVYKARKVVDTLRDYQRQESEELVQQYQCVRPYAMRWLTLTRCRKEKLANSEERAAKFRQVKPGKDPAAHFLEFRRRYSVRHTRAFKSSILRKRYAKAVPKSVANSRQLRVRPISMNLSPLRFLPCRRRADGKRLGLVTHCGCHRIHNLTPLYVKSLNAGLLGQVVSLAKWLRSDYYWPDLSAAIDLLMRGLETIVDADMEFFTGVRAEIEVGRLARKCKYDVAKGVRKPFNTALTRWGTTMGSGSHAFLHHEMLAFAIIQGWAHGPLDVRIRAAVKVLSPEGFDSDEFQQLRVEDCAKTVFAFLTNVSDILQLAIMHVLNAVVVRLLLAAFSANYECGVPLTMGVESLVRAILMVL